MAITVQDDTGSVVGANAYIPYTYWTTYHTDQGTLPSGSIVQADVEKAIIRATRYMDGRFGFIGTRLTYSQTTEWPRQDAFDKDDIYMTGIPEEIKEACAEYALIAMTQDLNPTPTYDESGQRVVSTSKTVGPLTVSKGFSLLQKGSGILRRPWPVPDSIIRGRGLLKTAGRVYRG